MSESDEPANDDSPPASPPGRHAAGGSLKVRASVLTNIPASAPGWNAKSTERILMARSFEPHE